jgi:hypothetical protein
MTKIMFPTSRFSQKNGPFRAIRPLRSIEKKSIFDKKTPTQKNNAKCVPYKIALILVRSKIFRPIDGSMAPFTVNMRITYGY